MEGQVVFLQVLQFLSSSYEWLAEYKWNILEKAVKPS